MGRLLASSVGGLSNNIRLRESASLRARLLQRMSQVVTHADEIQRSSTCRLSGLDRKWLARTKIDTVDPLRKTVALRQLSEYTGGGVGSVAEAAHW